MWSDIADVYKKERDDIEAQIQRLMVRRKKLEDVIQMVAELNGETGILVGKDNQPHTLAELSERNESVFDFDRTPADEPRKERIRPLRISGRGPRASRNGLYQVVLNAVRSAPPESEWVDAEWCMGWMKKHHIDIGKPVNVKMVNQALCGLAKRQWVRRVGHGTYVARQRRAR
jgi:hypothetical protein